MVRGNQALNNTPPVSKAGQSDNNKLFSVPLIECRTVRWFRELAVVKSRTYG